MLQPAAEYVQTRSRVNLSGSLGIPVCLRVLGRVAQPRGGDAKKRVPAAETLIQSTQLYTLEKGQAYHKHASVVSWWEIK